MDEIRNIDELFPDQRRALLAELLERRRSERPVSYSQRRLWFLDQLAQDGAAYNTAIALRLTGPLNERALADSLSEIVARHEVLRTTFAARDGEPVQVVAAPGPLALERLDLSQRDPEEQQEAVRTAAQEFGRRRFDLEQGPVLRAQLAALEAHRHVLSVAVHHIAYDGWSHDVLLKELAALYEAFEEGRPSPLAPLPIQYSDYAAWQRRHLNGELLAQQLDHARRKLAGAQPLELPTDRPRPRMQEFTAGRETLDLPEQVAQALEALSRQSSATLFMTTLAVLKLLLQRYSGQDDLVVGTPIAGRSRAETEGLVGCFINSVVLRTDLAGDPSLRELLARVRETCLDAFDHGDLPFERLVEELQLERDLSRNPLFGVLFMQQGGGARSLGRVASDHPEGLRAGGLTIRPFELDSGTTRFDLEISVLRASEGLRLVFNYGTALFERATIRRMLRHYGRLLEAAGREPDRPLSGFSLLDPAERSDLLERGHGPKLAMPPEPHVMSLVRAQTARTPEAVAARCRDAGLTYAELLSRADGLSRQLVAAGLGPGQRVGLHLERGLPMLVAVLGVLGSGAAYVPLDPALPQERLAFMVGDAELAMLISEPDSEQGPGFDDVPVWRLDPDGQAHAGPGTAGNGEVSHHGGRANGRPFSERGGPDDLAYVIYTSGSTGRPKGVEVPHRALTNLLLSMARSPGMSAHDVLLAVTTLSFDISILELLLPLTVGGQVVLASREETADGERLAALLESSGATLLQATPTTWRTLLSTGWSDGQRLTALVGGEAWGWDLAQPLLAACASVWNVYGPTETTVWSAARRLHLGDRRVLMGGAVANTRLYVLDGRGEPTPTGVPGELAIGGAGLARGYRNQPELTAQRFAADPFDEAPQARLFRTGDRVRRFEEGDLEFLGRLDSQIKLRGFRIELGEIESILGEHPAVRQAAAVVREDPHGDRRLVAYVEPAGEEPPTASELRSFLKLRVPDYMLPATFVAIDALPRTPNGKLDRNILPHSEANALELTGAYVAPRDDLERTIAGVWARVLGTERVGVHDNFFELGGHSIAATRLVAQLRTELDIELPLRSLFEDATVAGLARGMEFDEQRRTRRYREKARGWKSLVPMQPSGSRPPLFLVSGAYAEEEDLPQGVWKRDIKKARWDEAYDKTITAFTTQSKDLQIAVWLVHVLVKKRGFVGLQAGLQLLSQLHERFWASFYPKLSGEQTKERGDILDGFDADLPLLIRQIPLTQQPVYSWLDWQQSQHREEADPEESNDEDQASHHDRSPAEQFEEAVQATSCSFYGELVQQVQHSQEAYDYFDGVLNTYYGSQPPTLLNVRKALQDCQALVHKIWKAEKRGP